MTPCIYFVVETVEEDLFCLVAGELCYASCHSVAAVAVEQSGATVRLLVDLWRIFHDEVSPLCSIESIALSSF